jgi:8-oxo-dGTP pyrophosphatase MutT (NUDIX family)
MGYIEHLRRHVGHERLLNPGVRAIIRDGAGAILLQRRGDFGSWGLPAGGMELDESLMQTLRREVFEETGLRVVRAMPFGVYSDPRYSTTYPNGDWVQPVTLAFHVREWTGEPRADGEESLDLAFFPLDRLPPDDRMHPSHLKTIRDFARYREDGAFVVD